MITALTENGHKAGYSHQRSSSIGSGINGASNAKGNSVPNYVPYRESKLTTILKQSLGGNSFTLMIACLAPSDQYSEENISTLNYAARAAKIRNAPFINTDPKSKKIAD